MDWQGDADLRRQVPRGAGRDIGNDDHGVVILDHWMERDGKPYECRVDHIWELNDSKFTKFTERPGSEEESNRIWS